MIIDLKKSLDVQNITSDICIIGAGAAGLALFNEFQNTRYKVCLLESGNLGFDTENQKLLEGNFSYKGLGFENNPAGILERDRSRSFGGTTAKWGGMCATYDEIDFEKRDWVPYSGWPFSRAELVPFYNRASSIVNIPLYDFTDIENNHNSFSPLKLDDNYKIDTKMFYSSSVGNLARKYIKPVRESRNVTLYINATVKNININQEGVISSLSVLRNNVNLDKVNVVSKTYILATGAIENARILLSSNNVNKKGVSNDNDLVGRFFQGHGFTNKPTMAFSMILNHKLNLYLNHKYKEGVAFGFLSLSKALQKKYKTLQTFIGIDTPWALDGDDKFQTMQREIKKEYVSMNLDLGYGALSSNDFWHSKYSLTLFEQEPNPSSRVILSDTKDWLGMRKCSVLAKISELQKHTAVATFKALGISLALSQKGKVLINDNSKSFFDSLEIGLARHHHGTTRMSNSTTTGVVDSNCRSHFVKNLYIAGASVFPTSSATNPTYTIIAMSIRLADHLKSKENL